MKKRLLFIIHTAALCLCAGAAGAEAVAYPMPETAAAYPEAASTVGSILSMFLPTLLLGGIVCAIVIPITAANRRKKRSAAADQAQAKEAAEQALLSSIVSAKVVSTQTARKPVNGRMAMVTVYSMLITKHDGSKQMIEVDGADIDKYADFIEA